jgi:catechol 2,3-dioxygenase-like lactoylglutathione lyase family enzyme
MTRDLFAGIYVRDYEEAKAWYTRLFGSEPSFIPHATEAVWELAENRWVYINQNPEHAGHAALTAFVDDLDAFVSQISARGIEPVSDDTYSEGARKISYRDPDGNEIGFGGSPS